jgi:hypothetical protein
MSNATVSLPYNPFEKQIVDESERIIRKNYDDKFASFTRSAENRIAYQLSLRYFLDANPILGSLVKNLTGSEIVMLDGGEESENPMRYLFVGNCIPHQNVTVAEFSKTNLSKNQTLIISTDVKIEESHSTKIKNFVEVGGVVLSFNKAVQIISQIFPNTLTFKNGESTLDKRIDLKVEDTDDAQIFLGLQNAAQRKKATRFAGIRRFQVNPDNFPNVQVLVTETTPSQYPIAAKITYGRGFVFHFIHVGTDDLMELRSRDKAQFYCKQVEEQPNMNEATKTAWKTALSCSQWGSFYLAISLLPFFDIIFGIINKYSR